MSSQLRVAVAESLRAEAEAACGGLALRVVTAVVPAEERLRRRWQRIWQERRGGAGGNGADADAALQDGSMLALLAVLDRQADAALLSEADARWRQAWRMIEPRDAGGCADVWIGELDGPLGWCDWHRAEGVAAAAEQLGRAAREMSRITGTAGVPAVVNFAGGRNPLQPEVDRLLQTLNSRGAVAASDLYSPLFFPDGQLQAVALLRKVRAACAGKGTPVLCVPQLARAEFAAALTAAGGQWAGPFRAGAEAPVARLAPRGAPAHLRATLERLARLAAH